MYLALAVSCALIGHAPLMEIMMRETDDVECHSPYPYAAQASGVVPLGGYLGLCAERRDVERSELCPGPVADRVLGGVDGVVAAGAASAAGDAGQKTMKQKMALKTGI
ncbi:hypothetical protein [Aquitalea sp.]|uniref:hypothetical protein n=1 Tax=Aquitalea sp. TaxID=1872623 RepID=UPI0025825878|nr:hypothetical protein [Aquitalea sp.]